MTGICKQLQLHRDPIPCPQEVIPTSLLKLNNDNASRAVKMFLGIQRFMGETQEQLTHAARIEIAQKLLQQARFCAAGLHAPTFWLIPTKSRH